MRFCSRISTLRLGTFLVPAFILQVASYPVGFAAAPEIEVRITADRDEFLLGEPVVLRASVTNTGTTSLRLTYQQLKEHPEEEVKILASYDGRAFSQCNRDFTGSTNCYARNDGVEIAARQAAEVRPSCPLFVRKSEGLGIQ